MPHETREPDPNQRQTRSKNATAHPGKVVIEATGRCDREVIENEKRIQDERCQLQETKKAAEKAAVVEVARLENKMRFEDTVEVNKFPRHQSGTQLTNC
jgi:hypothetical protein